VSWESHIERVAAVFTEEDETAFGDLNQMKTWLREEVGPLEIMDAPFRTENGWKQTFAPRSIYHLCAGNLSIAAETSLLIGLLLRSRCLFKCPSKGLPDFERRVQALPGDLRETVEIFYEHDPERLAECDAVVLYGSNETVSRLYAQTRPGQRVLVYGHKISLGVVSPREAGPVPAQAAAREILAYNQLGCLSPQSYLCRDPEDVASFAENLVHALENCPIENELPFEAHAMRLEARQRAVLAGDLVISPENPNSWVVIQRQHSRIEPGPGFGFIEVVPAPELPQVLDPWKGLISAVSFSDNQMTPDEFRYWSGLGVRRFCRMGDLQRPPLAWPHDGRPRLGDLLTWSFADPEFAITNPN